MASSLVVSSLHMVYLLDAMHYNALPFGHTTHRIYKELVDAELLQRTPDGVFPYALTDHGKVVVQAMAQTMQQYTK